MGRDPAPRNRAIRGGIGREAARGEHHPERVEQRATGGVPRRLAELLEGKAGKMLGKLHGYYFIAKHSMQPLSSILLPMQAAIGRGK